MRREQAVGDRGQRGQRLERRARRIGDGRRPVEPGEVPLLRDLVVGQRLELLRVDAADVDGRLVGRVGRHREHRSVAGVERDDRAPVRVEGVVVRAVLDPVSERPLGRALEADVERQADVVARLRRPALGGPALALWNPHRVDPQLGRPCLAAEIGVERRLDTGLADLLAAAVALRLEALQLLLVDLADVPEHLRRQRPVLVVAQVRGHDRDPRELVRALEQRHDLVLVDGRLDEDRRQRVVLALLERSGQPGQRHAQHLREPLQHRVPPLLGQVGGPDLHRRAGHVGDDRVAGAVEDRAARRLERNDAQLVVLRRVQIAVAGEHLERPQTEEEHGEDDEGERGEHADPHRELRREAVRLRHPRIGRQERPGRRAALGVRASQGAAPPSPGRRPSAGAARPGSAPRSARRGAG